MTIDNSLSDDYDSREKNDLVSKAAECKKLLELNNNDVMAWFALRSVTAQLGKYAKAEYCYLSGRAIWYDFSRRSIHCSSLIVQP